MASVVMESPVGYHSSDVGILTTTREPGVGQCQVGSLTGAVTSERVTEVPKGLLSMVGNHVLECKGIRRPDCETDKSSREETRT